MIITGSGMPHDFDTVIIGAGVVGLACAAALSRRGQSALLLERHGRIGQETSSRNSGVLHAGIYYPTGSLKAQLCVRGRELLEERCRRNAISHRKVGKFIVATEQAELPRLLALQSQARRNGVELPLLEQRELRNHEPHLTAAGALWSAGTGIIDAHELAADLHREATAAGALTNLRTEVTALHRASERRSIGGWHVSTKTVPTTADPTKSCDGAGVVHTETENATVTCRWVVNAAGLAADRVAQLAGIDVDAARLRLHRCKGSYFSVAKRPSTAVSHLIYPLPGSSGLGVHLTFDMGGALLAGPDAEYVSRLDYSVPREKAAAFAAAVSRYLPGVTAKDLTPAYAGVRPKLQGPGDGFRDFVIEEAAHLGCPGLINLIGIESPGLTASPAIAEHVTRLILSSHPRGV